MDVLATALLLMSRKVELEGDEGWGNDIPYINYTLIYGLLVFRDVR